MKSATYQISAIVLSFGLVLGLIVPPSEALSQTSIFTGKPNSDPNDDEILCEKANSVLENDKYCVLYKDFKRSFGANNAQAEATRNQMIDLLRLQIDEYYNEYKNGRVKKTRRLQFLLDILGIGLAVAGNIVGGARSKTVLAASSGAFLAGRNSLNDRFDLVRQQILINKMNANRTNQWARIVSLKNESVGSFGWDAAKAEMQQYLFRGSFEDALDSLVEDTGAQVTAAQNNLQQVLDAVPEGVLEAKLTNFNDYIAPMNRAAAKISENIRKLTDEIATLNDSPEKEKKEAERRDLIARQENLQQNYQSILTALTASGDFDAIKEKVRTKYPEAIVQLYDQYLRRYKASPPTITMDEYDFVLTKINGVLGFDEPLGNRFLEILRKYKIQD